MKQTSKIISTYSADVFGVCSALFELGGMTIMHDASGCNSTYTTHDEPRWYDMDSMVYLSGLSEMEAIMGDDEKLIGDICSACEKMHPKFVAIAGTPIPMMTGMDFAAVAKVVEKRTGLSCFGFPTNGMNSYIYGTEMALEGIAERFADRSAIKTDNLSVNILGATPLDFSVNSSISSIKKWLTDNEIEVISTWAMGSTLEQMSQAGKASVNLVISQSGMKAAKKLNKIFGTPYVAGVPIGIEFAQKKLYPIIKQAAESGVSQCAFDKRNCENAKIAIIGESVFSGSLACAIEEFCGRKARVICPIEHEFLANGDIYAPFENEITKAIGSAEIVIADPLYKPICKAKFLSLPHEAYSGRIYRRVIPNMINNNEFLRRTEE